MSVRLCHTLCKTAVFPKTGNQNQQCRERRPQTAEPQAPPELHTTDIQARVALYEHQLLWERSNSHVKFKGGAKLSVKTHFCSVNSDRAKIRRYQNEAPVLRAE